MVHGCFRAVHSHDIGGYYGIGFVCSRWISHAIGSSSEVRLLCRSACLMARDKVECLGMLEW